MREILQDDFYGYQFGSITKTLLSVVCSDWRGTQIIFNSLLCVFHQCVLSCKSKGSHGNDCDCRKLISKIGLYNHQVAEKSDLNGMERWRILIESLHGRLRFFLFNNTCFKFSHITK